MRTQLKDINKNGEKQTDLELYLDQLKGLKGRYEQAISHLTISELTADRKQGLLDSKLTRELLEATLESYLQNLRKSKKLKGDHEKIRDAQWQAIKTVMENQQQWLPELQALEENKKEQKDNHKYADDSDGEYKSTPLSEQIIQTADLQYTTSYATIWWRRFKLAILPLLFIAAIIAVGCILATPGANVIAALCAVALTFKATLAWLCFQKPVVKTTNIPAGPMGVIPIHTPILLTPIVILQPIMIVIFGLQKKIVEWTVRPKRNELAKNVQTAVMNTKIRQLKMKIAAIDGSTNVKEFLEDIFKNALEMYTKGEKARLHEFSANRIAKARMMFAATAKLIENYKGADIAREDIGTLLNTTQLLADKEQKANYSFGQIINAQRHGSTLFSRRTSRTTDKLLEDKQYGARLNYTDNNTVSVDEIMSAPAA